MGRGIWCPGGKRLPATRRCARTRTRLDVWPERGLSAAHACSIAVSTALRRQVRARRPDSCLRDPFGTVVEIASPLEAARARSIVGPACSFTTHHDGTRACPAGNQLSHRDVDIGVHFTQHPAKLPTVCGRLCGVSHRCVTMLGVNVDAPGAGRGRATAAVPPRPPAAWRLPPGAWREWARSGGAGGWQMVLWHPGQAAARRFARATVCARDGLRALGLARARACAHYGLRATPP